MKKITLKNYEKLNVGDKILFISKVKYTATIDISEITGKSETDRYSIEEHILAGDRTSSYFSIWEEIFKDFYIYLLDKKDLKLLKKFELLIKMKQMDMSEIYESLNEMFKLNLKPQRIS